MNTIEAGGAGNEPFVPTPEVSFMLQPRLMAIWARKYDTDPVHWGEDSDRSMAAKFATYAENNDLSSVDLNDTSALEELLKKIEAS